ncbi:MAG: histidinol-phosphate transaminase [Bacillota bacterium]
MSDAQTPARREVLTLSPYIPGKPADEVKRELGLERVVKLASNENPLGPSPKAVERVKEMALQSHIYPDAAGFRLKSRLAEKYGVAPDQIVLGNGSDEIIMLIGETFVGPGDEVVMPHPSFPVYKTATLLMGGTPVEVSTAGEGYIDVREMVRKVGPRTKAFVLCNPNNPTGAMVSKADLAYVMKNVPPNVLVVVDEAYAEYVEDPEYGEMLPYLMQGRNVVILHTFSKIYGLAGLRVGFALTLPETASLLNRVRLSFNQNAIGQEAAEAALDDAEHVRRSVEMNRAGKDLLTREFTAMGLRIYPTWGNFIMVDTGRDAQALFNALLRRGVIVRPTTAWGMKTGLRITIGTQEENEVLLEALKAIL